MCFDKTDCQDYPLKSILNKQRFDSVIAIGVLIKGDTAHFEHIAESVSRGLMRLQLDNNVSIYFHFLRSHYDFQPITDPIGTSHIRATCKLTLLSSAWDFSIA